MVSIPSRADYLTTTTVVRLIACCVPATTAVPPKMPQVARVLVEAVMFAAFWPVMWGYFFIVAPIITCLCCGRIHLCEAGDCFWLLDQPHDGNVPCAPPLLTVS